jgi:NAD(P)H-dependent FMN reductase
VLKLKLLVGSTREGRAADRVVPWVTQTAEARDTFSVEVLDLREWNPPMFAETIHTVGDFSPGCVAYGRRSPAGPVGARCHRNR